MLGIIICPLRLWGHQARSHSLARDCVNACLAVSWCRGQPKGSYTFTSGSWPWATWAWAKGKEPEPGAGARGVPAARRKPRCQTQAHGSKMSERATANMVVAQEGKQDSQQPSPRVQSCPGPAAFGRVCPCGPGSRDLERPPNLALSHAGCLLRLALPGPTNPPPTRSLRASPEKQSHARACNNQKRCRSYRCWQKAPWPSPGESEPSIGSSLELLPASG